MLVSVISNVIVLYSGGEVPLPQAPQLTPIPNPAYPAACGAAGFKLIENEDDGVALEPVTEKWVISAVVIVGRPDARLNSSVSVAAPVLANTLGLIDTVTWHWF